LLGRVVSATGLAIASLVGTEKNMALVIRVVLCHGEILGGALRAAPICTLHSVKPMLHRHAQE